MREAFPLAESGECFVDREGHDERNTAGDAEETKRFLLIGEAGAASLQFQASQAAVRSNQKKVWDAWSNAHCFELRRRSAVADLSVWRMPPKPIRPAKLPQHVSDIDVKPQLALGGRRCFARMDATTLSDLEERGHRGRHRAGPPACSMIAATNADQKFGSALASARSSRHLRRSLPG
jgi:hypothetical protein